MILVTVGTQLPFTRLIGILDELAPKLGRPIVAQIGDDPVIPRHIEHHRNMAPAQFETLFRQANLIVAHAGIGTVLAAKKHRKPIIVFPRRAAMGEHRNDHQLATARQLVQHVGVYVAQDGAELEALLSRTDLVAPDGRPSPSLVRLQSTINQSLKAAVG